MANPLAAIRKYDKYLLAIFGVLLMVAFLIDDSLLSMITGRSRNGGGANNSVVTFKGGSLNDTQIQAMYVADEAARQVMKLLNEETLKKKKQPRSFPSPFPQPSEQQLVFNLLLAQRARDSGLTLSDADIDQLLLQFSNDSLDLSDLKKIRQKAIDYFENSKIKVSEKDIYAQLRTNFLAQEVVAMHRGAGKQGNWFSYLNQSSPTMAITPAEGWVYFRRVNRKVRVELLPLKVEDFLEQVKASPTTAQKNELFEKYKSMVPDPTSPEPAFATPQRIAFGYVAADLNRYLEIEKAKITDEQVRAEYDSRVEKGDFRVPVLPDDKKENEKPGDKQSGHENKSQPQPPAGENSPAPPTESGAPEKNPAGDEKSAPANDPELPSAGKSAAEPKDTESNGEKPDDSGKPTEEPSDNQDQNDQNGEESFNDAGAEPEVQPETSDVIAASDDTSAKIETPPTATPAAEPTADSDKVEAEPASATENSADKPVDKAAKATSRVRTFEEVKDDIREQLARKPAEDTRREALTEVNKIVRNFASKHREWEMLVKEKQKANKKTELPEKPDHAPALRDTVKKFGLSFKELDLMDRFEIEKEEIGRTSFFLPDGRSLPFSAIYNEEFQLFEPQQVDGGFSGGVQYLFWKEQEQEAKPAERKDADDAIVKAWKLQKAFELAQTAAKDLAAKARDKESLRAAFPDGVEHASAIQETAPFSWLTTGSLSMGVGGLQASRIPEVPYAGEEFMQTVLDLQSHEVGFAADQPHTMVYVIRVIDETPKEDALREQFASQGLVNPAIAMQYSEDQQSTVQSWMRDVMNEANVQWSRPTRSFDR